MRVRQSDLKTFGRCARQYYYASVLDIGKPLVGSLTVLGVVWHYATEVYENYGHDLDLAQRTFGHYWKHPEELGEKIDFWHRRTNYDSLKKRGHAMLQRYDELAIWREGRLIGTEIKFDVPIGEHVLTGTIDKLWVLSGKHELQVLDFKTARLVPEKLRQNIQFTAYCYATTRPEFWEQVPGHEEDFDTFRSFKRSGAWYHARNTKIYSAGYREHDDYRRLLLAIDSMEQAIEAGAYPLDISGESCGYCAFANEICGSEVMLYENTEDRVLDMVRRPDEASQGEGIVGDALPRPTLALVSSREG